MRTLLLLPLVLFANVEQPSMLQQAESVSKLYTLEIAKAATPSRLPQIQKTLDMASIWFTIDLKEIAPQCGESVLMTLANESFVEALREMGVQGIRLVGLKKGGGQRTGLGIDPRWGSEADWKELASLLQKRGIVLIGDTVGGSTGVGTDFGLALKNHGDYPGLYHLVEIEKSDWKLLPLVPKGEWSANVPWLSIQGLQKKGYITGHDTPYVKESEWNATDRVNGVDGKMRRWIYLKENKADPVLDWLDPSFAAMRLAAGDSLDSYHRLGEKIFHLDANLESYAQENLSLWIRKMGAFSAQEVKGGLANYKKASADLLVDGLTRPALLHALVTQDAEALKMIYRLYLEEEVAAQRFVHALQPPDSFACDWTELVENPKKKFRYYEEYFTGEVLRRRLMKEDMARLGEKQGEESPPATWVSYCAGALGLEDYANQRDSIAKAHLLLAFFYAMQPGAFSFSVPDLLGALPGQSSRFDLMGCNENTLYASFPIQLTNPISFASGLRQILQVRRDHNIQNGELVEVAQTYHREVLILIYRTKENGFTRILAINFGQKAAQETLEMQGFRQTTAINLITGLAETKSFESATFQLHLLPLSGKILFFQPKYYD
ncbi:MAG TPA: hypothetical protein VLE89_01940 [Chlamydiales bacterium]|nr:hypothetical protein [Chlamydiales bacterium]